MGGTELSFAKQYYKKPQVMANWTKALQEMRQVVDTGKPIFEAPLKPENTAFADYAKRIVDFETKVSSKTPDPERASESDVRFSPLMTRP